ncbi:right-handed parallel beta-helix repeat-containing protein [Chryseobacterium sp. MMS23-Vi53]|uniref:right-handed parallel beta-helix repeat-containing protein n=1 Tax=Chryseobacterium sp. MMS23-Vi53 TaxID=3386644 RepID=UPI0039EA98BA
MTNNLNLLTISEFIITQDSTLDREIVTLIDDFTGELVNFKNDNTIPTNGKYLYFTKSNSDNSIAKYRRMITGDVSVRISGAVGDGNTDDYSKIQKLIDEMDAGHILSLDERRYMLYSPLQINKAIKIKGSSTIGNKGYNNILPSYILTLNNNGIIINSSGVVLDGFAIGSGNSYVNEPNTNIGIKVNGTNITEGELSSIIIRDIFINGYETGLEISYMWSSQIQSLKILNCKTGILINGRSVNNEISNNTSISLADNVKIPNSKGIWFNNDGIVKEGWRIIDTLINNYYDAIYAEKTSHVNIMNSMIDFCHHIGIVLLDDCYNWNINSNYIALDEPGYGLYLANNTVNPLAVRGNKIVDNDILSYNGVIDNEISIGINIVGEGSLYDDVRGNSVKNFKVYDIKANEGLKTTISNNKCLSDVEFNIISNFITNDNLGIVYYQNVNDFFNLGKIKVSYAASYPTTSSSEWRRGDIILNTEPSVTNPIGWVNTTDGINTWKPFGVINN